MDGGKFGLPFRDVGFQNDFSIYSDSAIRVGTPPGTVGTVDVTITGPGGTSATSTADRFTYVLPTAPVISGVRAATGSTAGGYYATGAVQERYIYDPYGQATILAPDWSVRGASAVGWVYLFQGGRLDAATGLYQHRYRDDSPTLGRWLEQDPMRYVDGMNLYNDVDNNPVGDTDPLGLYIGWDDAIFAGTGALLGLGGQALGDLFSGHVSSWQSYAAAAIGGAAGGEATLYLGPVAGGAIGAAVGNGLDQGFNKGFSNIDPIELGLNTALGAGLGKFLTGPEIDGITAGRGSWEAVENRILSGLENGTYSGFSAKTGGKIAGAEAVKGAEAAGAGGIGSSLIKKLLDWLRGPEKPC